mmetsp:Transcript_10877/g.28593  ORF Transcript_10877/g.28593 Transcript_10877/m.28593 type:complete len:328 (+) Transcript_10877:1888-2871(+)
MRDDDDIVEVLETRLHQGFVFKDVEACEKLRVLAAMLNEVDLVHNGSARAVDEDRISLHQRETILIDQMVGRLVQVGVEADHVALLEDLLGSSNTGNRDPFLSIRHQMLTETPNRILQLLARILIIIHHVHPEPPRQHNRRGTPDPPGPNYAHGLSAQQFPNKQIRQPQLILALPHERVRLHHPPRARHHQTHRHLRRRLRQHPGGIPHRDANSRRPRDVDVIVAHRDVGVGDAAGGGEGGEEVGGPGLGELSDDGVDFGKKERFQLGGGERGGGGDLVDAAVVDGGEEVEPGVADEGFGDEDAEAAGGVVGYDGDLGAEGPGDGDN